MTEVYMARRYVVECKKSLRLHLRRTLRCPTKHPDKHTRGTLLIHRPQGKEGLVIVKTKQALLIGHYPENVQPGQAATTVEKLADYLIGVGY